MDAEQLLIELIKSGDKWANSEIGKIGLHTFGTPEEKEWFESYKRAKEYLTEKGLL